VLVRLRPGDRRNLRVAGGQLLLRRELHAELFASDSGDRIELHDAQRRRMRWAALHARTRHSVGRVRACVVNDAPDARVADERASLRDAFPAANLRLRSSAALRAADGATVRERLLCGANGRVGMSFRLPGAAHVLRLVRRLPSLQRLHVRVPDGRSVLGDGLDFRRPDLQWRHDAAVRARAVFGGRTQSSDDDGNHGDRRILRPVRRGSVRNRGAFDADDRVLHHVNHAQAPDDVGARTRMLTVPIRCAGRCLPPPRPRDPQRCYPRARRDPWPCRCRTRPSLCRRRGG
jgi:hypothetical protein